MNQKFIDTSKVLQEIGSLSVEDKHKIFKISIKLAEKGIHKAASKTKKVYNKKRIQKKIKKDSKKIYDQIVNTIED